MSFARVQTESREVNQLQQNIATVLLPLQQNPLLYGVFLESQVLAIGNNTLYPGLTKRISGWFITSINGAAQIYDAQATNTNPSTLILVSDAAVTVSLYVF